jgi:hypothetical protein
MANIIAASEIYQGEGLSTIGSSSDNLGQWRVNDLIQLCN